MICAECNEHIENEYFTCLDNFLQVTYFNHQDQSNNIFCSRECFCEALSVESAAVKEIVNG